MLFFFVFLIITIESIVVKLNSQTFHDDITSGVWFIKFYSPSCSHCKKLAPIWMEFSTHDFSSLGTHVTVNIAEFNCKLDNNNVCKGQGISAYPTILLFKDGEMIGEYFSKRSIESFKVFLKNQLVPKKFDGEIKELNEKLFDREIGYNNMWILSNACRDLSRDEKDVVNRWKGSTTNFAEIYNEDLRGLLKMGNCEGKNERNDYRLIYKNRVFKIGGLKDMHQNVFKNNFNDVKENDGVFIKPNYNRLMMKNQQKKVKMYLYGLVIFLVGFILVCGITMCVLIAKEDKGKKKN